MIDLYPNVNSVEEYLENLNETDFEHLLNICNNDIDSLNEEDFTDLMILAISIYSSELEVDFNTVMENSSIVCEMMKRLVATVNIYSLIKKGLLRKTKDETIFLYKDFSFERTKKGDLIAEHTELHSTV